MAETIAEVFIRLGASGIGETAQKLGQVNTTLTGLKESAQLAFAAMNPSITQDVIRQQERLRREFNEGSISIRAYVEGLREIQNASRVLNASFDQRESMASGLIGRFVGVDQQAEVEQIRRTVRELQSAGNLSAGQAGQINAGIDSQEKARLAGEYVARAMAYSKEEADAEIANTLRAFRVREETKQGVLALRNEMVERAVAYSDLEIEAELRNTRIAEESRNKQAREMRVLEQVSAEMSRGLVQDAKDKEAAEKAFLRALEKSKQEMSRGVSDVRKEENEDRLRSVAITRQQENAQEGFNRKVAEYARLAALGVDNNGISQETYTRAVAAANRELEHNINLHAMGKRGILGSREAMIQLSYALQDAAITWDQGLGRAMQASANNFGMIIPMMTKSIGLGMGLSVGFTALATAMAMWERSSAKAREETDKLNKSLNNLPAALMKIAEAQRNALTMRDLLFDSNPAALESAARERGRAAAGARERQATAEREAGNVGARLTAELTGGGFRGNVMNLNSAEEYRRELQKEMADRMRRNVTVSSTGRPSMTEEQIQTIASQDSAAAVRALQDQIGATEEYRAALEASAEASAESVRLTKEQKEAQKAHVEAVNQEIYALEREERAKRKAAEAAEKSAAAQNRRDTINRVERGLMSEPRQTAFGAFEEFQRNIEAIAGAGGMTPEEKAAMVGKTGELFQNTLNKTETDKTKSRFQPNFAGFSDFGRQFQMSLFEDPAAKDRKEQIRLQREANDEVRRLADALLGGIPGLPRFAPGGN